MESNFIKKKIVQTTNKESRRGHSVKEEIYQYGFVTLNKNHISEIYEASNYDLEIDKRFIYEYIYFCTGKKNILLLEKKSDFKLNIYKQLKSIKYENYVMSNGNIHLVVFD